MKGLERELIFSDVSHMSHLRLPDDLVDSLYTLYLETIDSVTSGELPAIDVFNEALYQITRIYLDPYPEENIKVKYIDDAAVDLGGMPQAYYVFCFVWLLLELETELPRKVKLFLVTLKKIISRDSEMFIPFRDWQYHNQWRKPEMDFSPSPVLFFSNYSREEWEKVTNHFSEIRIKLIVQRYESKDEQLRILKHIECAFFERQYDYSDDLPFRLWQ